MRPPRCYLQRLVASVEAMEKAILSMHALALNGDGTFTVVHVTVEPSVIGEMIRANRELAEHVNGCEECETP